MKFQLISDYCPTGDQPEAIAQLVEGVKSGVPAQTLLGVTGSGKTFTIANVIKEINRPTLILSHNKTLAAQLYNEFKSFFPNNAVEYYVSYYDYYQPEAYIPSTDTYIEKDLAINDEIDKLRLSATSALLSGRKDVVVISSVSCIYGMGNPADFYNNVLEVKVGMKLDRNVFLRKLVSSLYVRNDLELNRGMFRVKGDTVDISLAYSDHVLRVTFWDDDIESIEEIDADTGRRIVDFDEYKIYPANLFMTTKESTLNAIHQIEDDLTERVEYFKEIGKPYEAKRLYERVTYDMEMMRELGHCSGIENYSRYFDGREPGTRPYCLLDFFPEDFLMVIDESHVSVPQIHAMYGGDRARKMNLVEFGFRLPAALDNRPLKFEEFQSMTHQVIYVSATPDDYELSESGGVIVEQLIRPTGLLDPIIEVRPSMNQVDDLMEEIEVRIRREERVLVTTLTKRMAEELTEYLQKNGVRCNYIHSDVDTLERVQIMNDLREGLYDVLIGVNLLREGLDLPEVSLVAILDADKEGFLRSHRSLTQTAGRAARNVNGKVIFYADRITASMKKTMDETNRRREKQIAYNEANGITPKQIRK
ncbi:MAG: excinuclease ABC subunit UvrB, partial [Bacteroidaceae bacterium]|nr:excinuclease ABC subunit UvrB [Bacteroidaceae bacterium]